MARNLSKFVFFALLGFSCAFNDFGFTEEEVSAFTNPYVVTSVSQSSSSVYISAAYQAPAGEIDFLGAEQIIQSLSIVIQYDNAYRVRVTITDANNSGRWRVPDSIPPYSPTGPGTFYSLTPIVVGQPLSIKITRTTDNKVVFFLNPNQPFGYNDQDIGFANWLGYPIQVMGLGERISSFVLAQGSYTLYARDRGSPIDTGDTPDSNMYSAQPFYLAVDNQLAAHGGLFLNSNAMTSFVGSNFVGFRTTGGIIDFFLFIGPEPADVIYQYHQLIGNPTLVPWWGLGWHQCRWGMQNISVVANVSNSYTTYNLPLDAMWIDIDYMNQFQDFTLDPVNFPQASVSAWVAGLTKANKHFVPIVDAGIAQNTQYATYSAGLALNVYIASPNHAGPTTGVVWPGTAVFVDWTNPKATAFWTSQLTGFQTLAGFSGIWLDMNEASNFVNGEPNYPPTKITNLTMPYTPGQDVNMNSLDVASTHYGGVLEYNLHSMFGFYETFATFQYFSSQNLRPFIITRSSFVGTGRYAGKWTGDNFSQWSFMAYSITGLFDLGMFGIAFAGADICGFQGNTNEELCSRWMQLGTLYPFSRNHNQIMQVDQYPWSFGPTLLQTSNIAIRTKYSLLLHFATGMFRVSQNGGMHFRPAFFDYPNDINLLNNATSHFMLGEGLIVHPVLSPGLTRMSAYFPSDLWYDFYQGTYTQLNYYNTVNLNVTLPGPIPIHVRGGHIISTLDNSNTVLDAITLRKSPITLVVALNGAFQANGHAVFDNGVSASTISANEFTMVNYHYQYLNQTSDTLIIQPSVNGYTRPAGEFPYISNIIIYGCVEGVRNVFYSSNAYTGQLNPVFLLWNPTTSVCKINLSSSRVPVQPDVAATITINFYL
ncbi:unnamed protein product [Blepharisma stoltei]|uniref:Maltase n=1 Tax=Blepharisma stoltei TaxID=1481888 RepID=A0AAU9JB08_9CILI|nr:unnamed protein product [Blepharisma stoltei]